MPRARAASGAAAFPPRAATATLVAALALALAGCTGGAPSRSGDGVGYVDIDALVKAHPLHGQLQALEDQIAALDAQAAAQPLAVTPAQVTAQAALERDLQAAAQKFEADLATRRAYYQQQAQAEMARIESEALAGAPTGASVPADMQRQFAGQMRQLQVSGAKTLEAYRSALFKADTDRLNAAQQLIAADVRAKVRAKASDLAAKETAYQVQLVRTDQQQRLNLKTRLENLSLSPQERAQDAAQLQDIETREEFLADQLKTKDDKELAAYESALQKAAAARFDAERGAAEHATAAKLVARQDELNRQFRAQAQTLGGKLDQQLAGVEQSLGLNPKVQQQFQDVQVKTESKYEADAAQASAAYRQTRKALVDKYSAIAGMQFQDQEALQAQIQDIAAQRRDLYQKIVDQVEDQVRTVAQARGVGMVFESVAGAGSAVDLTDQVAKAIAALPAATPSPMPSGG